jgi:pimeloyl-ACP methyl ester carboxylesterase
MSGEWARLRRLTSRLDRGPARSPTPPPGLPPGYIVSLEGRGETFVRHHHGPPDAPVVLLLHGWTASADLQWCTLYPALCERYSVIAIDHRGHGRGIRSEERFTLEDCADDAAAVVKVLEPGRQVIAIGYSMGGPITLQLWRRHPEVVAGLVFEATAMEMHDAREDRFRWHLLNGLFFMFRMPPDIMRADSAYANVMRQRKPSWFRMSLDARRDATH